MSVPFNKMSLDLFLKKDFGVMNWIDVIYQSIQLDPTKIKQGKSLELTFEDQVALDLNPMGRCATIPLKESFIIMLAFHGRMRHLVLLNVGVDGLQDIYDALVTLLKQDKEITIYENKRYYDADTEEILGLTQSKTVIHPKALDMAVWNVDELIDFIDQENAKKASPQDSRSVVLADEKLLSRPVPSAKPFTRH